MVKRRCKICDGEVTGSFCPTCKQFVETYTVKQNFYLNERHSDFYEEEKNCEYHHPSGEYGGTSQRSGTFEGSFEAPDYAPKSLDSKPFVASEEVYGKKNDTDKTKVTIRIIVACIVAFYFFCMCCGIFSFVFS